MLAYDDLYSIKYWARTSGRSAPEWLESGGFLKAAALEFSFPVRSLPAFDTELMAT